MILPKMKQLATTLSPRSAWKTYWRKRRLRIRCPYCQNPLMTGSGAAHSVVITSSYSPDLKWEKPRLRLTCFAHPQGPVEGACISATKTRLKKALSREVYQHLVESRFQRLNLGACSGKQTIAVSVTLRLLRHFPGLLPKSVNSLAITSHSLW